MSFFDSITDAVSDFYPALKVGADIYGAVSSVQANKKATKAAQAGVREANELTQAELDRIKEATGPAIAHQREAVSRDPYRLTPEQQRELDEIRQSARRTITGGPLAGSGRAQVRAYNEMEGAARDRMTRSNTERADMAAGNLSRVGFTAGVTAGQTAGDAAVKTAMLGANKTLANTRVAGQAIGDVLGYINDENKAKKTGVSQTIPSENI